MWLNEGFSSLSVRWDSRRFSGFVGLKNQGATCYMNSILQMMFFTNKLRLAIYQMPIIQKNNGIFMALKQLFYQLQFSDDAVSTCDLTSSFGWHNKEVLAEQDVQEFCRLLFDTLEESMTGTSFEGTIPSLFRGKTRSFVRCLDIAYKSTRDENFYDLQLHLNYTSDSKFKRSLLCRFTFFSLPVVSRVHKSRNSGRRQLV